MSCSKLLSLVVADVSSSPPLDPQEAFLISAAHQFDVGGWIFTGFNWPVLAARLARRINRTSFVQVLEPGAGLYLDSQSLLTSTTDYNAYGESTCWIGSSADVLISMVPRCDLVLIDAANVDIRGRVNTQAIGPLDHPKVRMPGGGGGPDVMARARSLVLLHGGADINRIVARVEHVTGEPMDAEDVRLVTRWGTLSLIGEPVLLSVADTVEADVFIARMNSLGVETSDAEPSPPPTTIEVDHARVVLDEARRKGYRLPATMK